MGPSYTSSDVDSTIKAQAEDQAISPRANAGKRQGRTPPQSDVNDNSGRHRAAASFCVGWRSDERLAEAGRERLQWPRSSLEAITDARPVVPFLAVALGCAMGLSAARADIYTWTDAGGRVNISNLAPPEGARVTSVLHEAPKPARPQQPVETAPQPDVRALAERVMQLESELDLARRQPPPSDLRGGAAATPVCAATDSAVLVPRARAGAELWLRMRSVMARLRVRVVAVGLPGEHRRRAKPRLPPPGVSRDAPPRLPAAGGPASRRAPGTTFSRRDGATLAKNVRPSVTPGRTGRTG